MAKAAGFPTGGTGTIIGKNAFKPADSDKTYHSVEIGYIGGALKFTAEPAVANMAEEGEEMDFRGMVGKDNKGNVRLTLTQLGKPGTLVKRAS